MTDIQIKRYTPDGCMTWVWRVIKDGKVLNSFRRLREAEHYVNSLRPRKQSKTPNRTLTETRYGISHPRPQVYRVMMDLEAFGSIAVAEFADYEAALAVYRVLVSTENRLAEKKGA